MDLLQKYMVGLRECKNFASSDYLQKNALKQGLQQGQSERVALLQNGFDAGLSDAQVFSIVFAFASFVLLPRTHRVSVNVVLFYRVRVSCTRIAYRIIFRVSRTAYCIARNTKGNYAVFVRGVTDPVVRTRQDPSARHFWCRINDKL